MDKTCTGMINSSMKSGNIYAMLTTIESVCIPPHLLNIKIEHLLLSSTKKQGKSAVLRALMINTLFTVYLLIKREKNKQWHAFRWNLFTYNTWS